MKACVFIIPYFGEFKNYFPLFLLSCKVNSGFDWLLFTDNNEEYDYPVNMKVVKISFAEFRKLINSAFPFEISLDRPYKLCDYKPAYGYIFNDYIQDYQYWGYCDCDLLMGNFEKLLLPLLDCDYDKIFAAGHMTIYKNTDKNNSRFMQKHFKYGLLYNRVFTSDRIYAFDEMCYSINVHTLFEDLCTKLYCEDLSYNISTVRYRFVRKYYDQATHRWYEEKERKNLIVWDGKNIIEFSKNASGNICRKEYLYIHLQSRVMGYNKKFLKDSEIVAITPIGFLGLKSIPEDSKDIIKLMKLPINKERLSMGVKSIYHFLKSGIKAWEFNPYQAYK